MVAREDKDWERKNVTRVIDFLGSLYSGFIHYSTNHVSEHSPILHQVLCKSIKNDFMILNAPVKSWTYSTLS